MKRQSQLLNDFLSTIKQQDFKAVYAASHPEQ